MYRLIIISMEYERLSDRRFCALKYNIVLQGSIFSSHGLLVCCGITILFIYKVLLDERLKPFTVMLLLWCGSAGNNKVVRCNSVVVVIHKVVGGC